MNTITRKHENFETHSKLPRTVIEIGKIHFEGNIIPHTWYNHIKLLSGKPDVVGIIILSEIIYWYRPVTGIDEQTGRKVIKRAKFSGDKFRSPIVYYQEKFGFTKDQVRQALKRLEEGGYIMREYRDYTWKDIGKPLMTNMTYVEPVAEKILEITHPEPDQELEPGQENSSENPESSQELGLKPVSVGEVSIPQGEVSIPQGEVSIPQGEVSIPQGEVSVPHPPLQDQGPERLPDLLKITTKISTEISTTTTPTPPPSNSGEPLSAECGSGNGSNELIYPKELLSEEREEAARILKAVDGQAQQLLDELAGQLKAKEIKNPLGYLRGLIAKEKEGKFSATAGIKVGEIRRQRARIEASIKASEERASKPLEEPRREERWRQLEKLRKLKESLGATAHP